ncbi:MAG TPA: ABC transporter [Rheinheimera sp.]|nr:ABC transporter [Rheinheimera sp.]
MQQPQFNVNNLGKDVQTHDGRLHILTDISMRINAGETVAVVGESGSGKSTLLGLLAGLDVPSQGEVWFEQQPFSKLTDDERAAIRASKTGFVFQSFLLLQALTALENIMLPAELAGIKDARKRALNLLEQVGLLHRAEFFPGQLSGGEQQRVAIARAFITMPKVLFADEPSANLDAATGKKIEDLLFELNAQHGTTLILVTHSPVLAARCQRQIQLAAGKIVGDSAC